MRSSVTSLFLLAAMVALPNAGRAQAAPQTPVATTAKIITLGGDWQGTLDTGGGQLRLVLHIAETSDGGFQATLDSVDQSAPGIPVTSMSLQGGKLTFAVGAVGGSYDGMVSADGALIEGTWTQGRPLPLIFRRAFKPSDIDGIWQGTLATGAAKLRLRFHIVTGPNGTSAALDSVDQGALGLPLTFDRDGNSIKMEMKQIGGRYSGTLNRDKGTIDGTWIQGRGPWPLALKKADDKADMAPPRRPQNPSRPYPYREEEVSYRNKSADITLAATLTLPQGQGPFPAVVLITGSGPQDRDEALMGHRPFLVLSDYLTRRGIAVLRADDRGTAKSTGNFATATTADFATDTEAGIAYLKGRREIDQRKIGLIGHSEGGMIAPMVAARNSDVAFIVLMAGTGVPGDEVLVAQVKAIAAANGGDPAMSEKLGSEEREVTAMVRQEKDTPKLENMLRGKIAGHMPEAQMNAAIKQMTSPWMRFFIEYDPATALRKVKCGVLAINGGKDLQVLPQQNLPAIRKALEAGGNRNFEVVELPGLNHLFQTAATGSPTEYARIEETIAPAALEKIAGWIARQ
ncbi:MAG TPA: alpha/beta fold hydrolase [Candidatus Saccharimonadales bacterium]|jgi:fermentation-respiration switch protein FrsA (DUF1100 family)|nr:alpha/beta fold hydrolase [Candidatus Saccharimonadales bacterium]